ncbi:DNA replication and repair protein RecO [Marinilabilia salmonicolor]|jgi:DNA repair protein RecO (recombination protein O)|uniref:DNA repair protein RecO n=2 Tax=Marinilabilia salmonicolor TaxID=989 RepID=A0A368USN7_9BACT|nr:DNA replication and repair protein RecO [Marinilabilia salmonicolor]
MFSPAASLPRAKSHELTAITKSAFLICLIWFNPFNPLPWFNYSYLCILKENYSTLMSTLIKTSGIILDHVLYRETSAIIHIYTRELGRQNYIVNGVRGNRKSRKTILLQPLNRVKLEVYHSPRKDLHRIKEFYLDRPLVNVPYHQSTRAQAFFLVEVLAKVLVMQDPAAELFDFLDQSLDLMDSGAEGTENIHLFILFRLTHFLGFYPNHNVIGSRYWFDLKNGDFTSHEPAHPLFLNPGKAALFNRLFDVDVFTLKEIAKNASERSVILNSLLDFYRLHTNSFGSLKSLEVLQSMFHQ